MNQKLNCIMLIDDDEPTNFLTSMMIEEASCTEHIQIEDTGDKAINYLVNSEKLLCNDKECPKPDLIFLDINMPAMNGWEFLTNYNMLNTEHKGRIIIVMLTTSLNPEEALKANEIQGISGFENKPLTREALDKILEKYFPNSFPGDDILIKTTQMNDIKINPDAEKPAYMNTEIL